MDGTNNYTIDRQLRGGLAELTQFVSSAKGVTAKLRSFVYYKVANRCFWVTHRKNLIQQRNRAQSIPLALTSHRQRETSYVLEL